MRIYNLCLLGVIAISSATSAAAQDLLQAQPPIWSKKPDVGAFEKMENDRLTAAQRAIDLNPQLGDAYLNRAEVELTRQNHAEALRWLDALL